MATLVIKNIGKIVSGDIDHPVLEGSVIVINENLIEAIGGEELLANVGDATVVDANGTTVTPGLWDTHVHVSTADGYGTRQKTFGFIESAKNGGVTTMISAGECHIPGHPKGDPVYTKAQAIVGHKCFAKGVSGVKVEGGGLILEKGLVEKDFEDLAKEGVWVVGEIGLGTVNNPETAGSHGRVGPQARLQGADAHRRYFHPRLLHRYRGRRHQDEARRCFPHQWRPDLHSSARS